MGRDDRYTETYSSAPEGHQGPYVIPPLDEMTRRGRNPLRPRTHAAPPTAPYAPAPPLVAQARPRGSSGSGGVSRSPAPRPRRRRLAWLVLLIVVAAVLIVSGTAGALFGLFSSSTGSAGTEPGWSSGEEQPGEATPSAVPSFAPAPGLDEFAEADQARLDAILADPAAHVGEAVVAYAEVIVADTVEEDMPPGASAHVVSLSARQPASAYEFSDLSDIVLIDPGTEGVDAGDVMRTWLVVPDPASFTSVYATGGLDYVRLEIAKAEIVGFHDLTGDVAVGEVDDSGEVPILPVTAHNVADRPMELAIDLTATLPDGSEAATTVAWTGAISPGETVTTEVALYGDIPNEVEYRVDGVRRYEE